MYTYDDKINAIKYCKGRITLLEGTLKSKRETDINKEWYNKNTTKLKCYLTMLEAVESLKGDDEE